MIKAIKDDIGIGRTVTITQVGVSPAGNRAGLGVEVVGRPEHSLQVGDHRVFFVRQMDFPWREGGKRSAIHFVGYPESAYLKQRSDGQWYSQATKEEPLSLDELQREINDK